MPSAGWIGIVALVGMAAILALWLRARMRVHEGTIAAAFGPIEGLAGTLALPVLDAPTVPAVSGGLVPDDLDFVVRESVPLPFPDLMPVMGELPSLAPREWRPDAPIPPGLEEGSGPDYVAAAECTVDEIIDQMDAARVLLVPSAREVAGG